MLRTLMSRIRGTFDRDRLDDEFDDEARVHLELLTRRFVDRGMTPDEAYDAARRQFGRVTKVKEDLRERRALPGIDAISRDVRHAARQLRRAPGFTTAAVVMLAVGIGATSTVFAVLDAVVLRPLPYASSARLMTFRSMDRRGTPHPAPLSYPTFFDFRSGTRTFDRFVAYRDARFTLAETPPAIQVPGEIVSWDLFQTLGVPLSLGRGFMQQEERPGSRVVVLGHTLWQGRFGGDPQIVGRRIRINREPYTIVGVAAAGFQFPMDSPGVQLWTTLSEDSTVAEGEPLTEQRGARVLDVIGLLKPGITPEQAQAQMDQIAAGLAERYPDDNRNVPKTFVLPEVERLAGGGRAALWSLLGAVGLVLLIACANVANLLLARTNERSREFALRLALGASRAALVRQLIIESLVLGLLGAAGGLGLASFALGAIIPIVGDSIPRLALAAIDGRVLGFSTVIAVLTSVLFGLAPALQAGWVSPAGTLKDEGRGVAGGRNRLRSILVVAQVTLGLVLLVGAELLVTSFMHLSRRDTGFRSDHLLTFDVGLPDADYNVDQQLTFFGRLLDRLRAVPGVTAASLGTPLPMSGSQMRVSFDIEEHRAAPPDRPHSDMAIVDSGYFSTMGIPVLKGRDFTQHDTTTSPRVLIVNDAFARKYFPGENAIGKRIEPGATNRNEEKTMREIVGVVGNAKQVVFSADPDPIYYFPQKQLFWGAGTVVLRTAVPPLEVESGVRAATAELDSHLPIFGVRTGEERAAAAVRPMRFLTSLMASFAAIALLLTAVGLYGVLSYSVSRRRREIGVRIALGARRGDVLRLVLGEGLLLVGIGLLAGIAGAAVTSRVLASALYETSPGNPLFILVACGVLALAGIAAAYLPASRAASVDPMQTLRAD